MAKRISELAVCLVALWALTWAVGHAASPSAAAQEAAAQNGAAPAAPAADKRVLIISVDAMRPDLALRAETPTIRSMLKKGTFTFWARTTAVSITLPSHTSMLTGVKPDRHGIVWNVDLPLKQPIYPAVPTLFELAHKAGLTTAMAAGKSKFSALAKPHTLDWSFIPNSTLTSDQSVTDQAVAMIREHQPQVLFVHLPDVDTVGHKCGWGSDEQIKAIENADAQIRRLLDALDEKHLRDRTLIIVTADHGGAGKTHGADDPRSRHIPWIVTGPGVRENYDLTLRADLTINTEDTFATACWFLDIPLPDGLDGKPVTAVMKQGKP
jgi:predicted AlkP superfamily pyrophosphatase or phosphodiesterase